MSVAVIEKKIFPREVLCGEFLSHEVVSAIKTFGLYEEFLSLRPNRVTKFSFIPENGREASGPLGFEGFALKRSLLDQMLLNKAISSGATVIQPAEVVSIQRINNIFEVLCKTSDGVRTFTAKDVIAAYGKQNILDRSLQRDFISHRSGYNGIKYHINKDMMNGFADDEIRIYASHGIYCGVNCLSDTEATICFLSDKNTNHLDPKLSLNELLDKNPKFRILFVGDPVTAMQKLPVYGTGNIYFGRRNLVENGIYMIGDAARVIAPLAGDGIGMAIESGELIARVLTESKKNNLSKQSTETLYEKEWEELFSKRISVARSLQHVALNSRGGNIGGAVMEHFPLLTEKLIQWTRK